MMTAAARVEARVRMEGGSQSSALAGQQMLRLAIIYPGDNQALVTLYDGTGTMLLQLETTQDAAGNQMAQMLFERDPQGKPANVRAG